MANALKDNLLLDTDVFIDHLRGAFDISSIGGDISYSTVTRCELFAGKDGDEDAMRKLLSPFTEILVDRNIAEQAGRLRREIDIRTPDALIAASAKQAGRSLVTKNTKDFISVPGLEVLAPGEIAST